MMRVLTIIGLIVLCYSPHAWAVTTVISDNTTGSYIGDYTGTDDAALQEADPTSNHGADSQFEVSKYGSGSHTHLLIRFAGLSNITGPVTVTAVTLGMYLTNSDEAASHTINIYRALRAWNVSQTTWNVYTTGNNWTTAGALSSGNDRAASTSGQITGVQTPLVWVTVTQTTTGGLIDDVQGWINGTVTNNGWHLERNGTGNDSQYRIFTDSDGTNGERPYLSVTYTTGAAGATGSLMLMGVGK
jgi:hypothetical protein